MPQLDKFTYFTQFLWSCLLFFTFYILLCNDGDGILGINRILKLRNQLVLHWGNKIRSNDPQSLVDILRKGLSAGVSYMYSSLFEVSQWYKSVDYFRKRRKITLISCFGEISGSRGMERNIFYFISKSSYNTSSSRITCRNYIMLIHVLPTKEAPFFNLIKAAFRDSFSRNGRHYKKDRLLFKSTHGLKRFERFKIVRACGKGARPSQMESQPFLPILRVSS